MSIVHLAQASSPFMACGFIESPASPALNEKIHALDATLRVVSIEGYGYFFFTTPFYVDLAENEEMVGIKLGLVRVDEKLVPMSTLLDRDLITPFGVQHEDIHGNGLLLCFSKREPRFCAYKTLLAAPQLYYSERKGNILCTNNLRLMADLLDRVKLNPAALPLHFLFRSVSGRQTYLSDVYRLCPGEVLNWHASTLTVTLRHDLRVLFDRDAYNHVEPAAARYFYERLKGVMSIYLDKMAGRSAMLLSGGVDSSLLQASVNDYPASPLPPLSFSYALDAPSFAPEIGYAKAAVRTFNTNHTFIEVHSADYPDLLVESIEILGQPPHHESTPCVMSVAKYVSTHKDGLDYLFGGVGADPLHGLQIGRQIHRAEKHRSWPVFLLRMLGAMLSPVWQSKAYGARQLVNLVPYLNNFDSHHHPMNAQAMYTDWQLVNRCFGPSAVCEALAYRRELETRYIDSPCLIEKVHMTSLLSDDYDTATLWRQLGLAYRMEIIFPFMDDTVLAATLAFDPRERYFFAGRTKPILKMALEQRTSTTMDKPKYGSGFGDDLPDWMREGVLRDMVQSIERPAFMERADFECKLEQPDWFTWNLLTLDLFQKRFLKAK
jgi:asparagine synthetase B (glutamine-hydrolysing)